MFREVIQRVAARFIQAAAAKKLSPTQLEVLVHPDRIRTPTQVKNADKLVELGFLEKKPHPSNPNLILYYRTTEGGEYLKKLEDAKDDLTPENIHEVARKFPDFTNPRVDVDRGCIFLAIRDPSHGNTAVDTVRKVPTDKEVENIVNELTKEIKHRALKTRERWKYIPR
jgi:DNA-binding MarR family transcriptional regulator